MEELFLIAIGLIVWYWNSTMRAREKAVETARRACHEMGVSLLDDTVCLSALRVKRDSEGRLRLRRFYGFEYAHHPGQREEGLVILLGTQLDTVLINTHQTADNQNKYVH